MQTIGSLQASSSLQQLADNVQNITMETSILVLGELGLLHWWRCKNK